jgi:glutamate dehydrogenase
VLFDRMAKAVRGHMADLLRCGAGRMQPGELVALLKGGIDQLAENTSELLRGEAERQSTQMLEELTAAGAPRAEAAAVVRLFQLDGSAGIARLAADSEMDAVTITRVFTGLGERLGLDWAQGTAAVMNPSDPWERLLIAGLARDLQQVRLDFLRRLARRAKARNDLSGALEGWLDEHAIEVRNFRSMIARARGNAEATPAMLAQVASQARGLLS